MRKFLSLLLALLMLPLPGALAAEKYETLPEHMQMTQSFEHERLGNNVSIDRAWPVTANESVNAELRAAIDQLETHPLLQQRSLKEFLDQQDIRLEAWSPLARNESALMDNEIIRDIASLYKKSPQQIVIRWHLDCGLIVIPKSVTPSRIAENFDVFSFALDAEDMAVIAGLDQTDGRIGPNPMTATF